VGEVRAPAYLWVPPRLGSYGDEAIDLAKMYGRPPDPEQEIAIDAILSYGPGGKSVALEAADIKVRQNGKTGGDMTAACMYRVFLAPPDRTIWTAHLFKTAREAFDDHLALITNTDFLRKRVKKVRQANGEEGIELLSGARLDYMARSKGGGRGLGSGTLFMDEALVLSEQSMAAIFPTMSARPDPLIVYGSSPGTPESVYLRLLRDRGRAGGDASLIYIEHTAPGSMLEPSCVRGVECTHELGDPAAEGCALDNIAYREEANPALPRRISYRYVEGERRALPWRSFARERMGWWDDPVDVDADKLLSVKAWQARTDVRSLPADGEPVAVCWDTSPGMMSASVVLATYRDDGDVHLELIAQHSGTAWLGRYLNGADDQDGLVDRLGLDEVVTLPTDSNLATLEGMPEDLAAMTTTMTRAEVAAAAVRFEAMLDPITRTAGGGRHHSTLPGVLVHEEEDRPEPGLWHLDDPALLAAVVGLRKRPVGDGGWVPSRASSSVDISAVCAALGAVSALQSADQIMDPGAMRL
jgi:hypothetical protein